MTRLRSSLGAPKAIQTVVKRGYRIALDYIETESDCDAHEPAGAVAVSEGSKY